MERIIIDTDLGIDDTIGIALALGANNLQVEGITLVSSIGEIEEAMIRADQVLTGCDAQGINFYRGANYPLEKDIEKVKTFKEKDLERFEGLVQSGKKAEYEVGVDYLIRMAQENPGEITLVTMGALTNVAIALQKDEAFAKNIKRLVIGGGSQQGGNCTPVAEFNFWADPHAAKRVFESGIEMMMIGLDTTRQVDMTKAYVDAFASQENKEAQLISQLIGVYKEKTEVEAKMARGLFDAVVPIASLIQPEVLETEPSHVCIEVKGGAKGQSIVDKHAVWNNGRCNCQVACKIDQEVFEKMISERFFK